MQRFRPVVTGRRVLARGLQYNFPRRLYWNASSQTPRIDYQFISDDRCWAELSRPPTDTLRGGPGRCTFAEAEYVRAFVERRADPYTTALAWKSSLARAEPEEDMEEGKAFMMCGLLADVIMRFPSEHDRIVDLVEAMHDIAAVSDWRDHGAKSLADTTRHLRDWLVHEAPSDDDSYHGGFDMKYAWTNSCAYWARLAVRHLSQYGDTFFLRWGAEDITKMLESPRQKPAVYNEDLPACCQWLKIAGKEIYQVRHQRDAFSPQVWDSKQLWKGKPGFSPERWQFWKERLLQLRDLSEVSYQNKRTAHETVAEMNRIEAIAEIGPSWDHRFGPETWEEEIDTMWGWDRRGSKYVRAKTVPLY